MLPKKERLSTKEVARLKDGKSVFGLYLSIRYIFAPITKFAVSVSKKSLKNAIDRNRMRRRVYAAVGNVKQKMKTPALMMIMPKKNCLTIPLIEIEHEIITLLNKIMMVA